MITDVFLSHVILWETLEGVDSWPSCTRASFSKSSTLWSHLSDSTENLLLVGVHLCEGADLSQVDVLPVAQRYDLVKGKDQVEAVLGNLALLQHAAVFWDLGR